MNRDTHLLGTSQKKISKIDDMIESMEKEELDTLSLKVMYFMLHGKLPDEEALSEGSRFMGLHNLRTGDRQ